MSLWVCAEGSRSYQVKQRSQRALWQVEEEFDNKQMNPHSLLERLAERVLSPTSSCVHERFPQSPMHLANLTILYGPLTNTVMLILISVCKHGTMSA